MRISEQFESYRHVNILESELKELALQIHSKLNNCRVGYTFITYEDGKQLAFIVLDKALWEDFERKLEFGEHNIRLLSLRELQTLQKDWQEVINKYYDKADVINKYTEIIKHIHWIDLEESLKGNIIQDKLIALLSIFDSVLVEYEQVGKKEKTQSRRDLEKLYHITRNLCNVLDEYIKDTDCDELKQLNRELGLFRVALNLDSRDSKGKYADLIRFCKNINWNKAGLSILIKLALEAISSNDKIIENNG